MTLNTSSARVSWDADGVLWPFVVDEGFGVRREEGMSMRWLQRNEQSHDAGSWYTQANALSSALVLPLPY